jgi:hypothetical protein
MYEISYFVTRISSIIHNKNIKLRNSKVVFKK